MIEPLLTKEFKDWWETFYGTEKDFWNENDDSYQKADALNEYRLRRSFAFFGWMAQKELSTYKPRAKPEIMIRKFRHRQGFLHTLDYVVCEVESGNCFDVLLDGSQTRSLKSYSACLRHVELDEWIEIK